MHQNIPALARILIKLPEYQPGWEFGWEYGSISLGGNIRVSAWVGIWEYQPGWEFYDTKKYEKIIGQLLYLGECILYNHNRHCMSVSLCICCETDGKYSQCVWYLR